MSDKDITYRWLTQAELDDMVRQAFVRGAEAMREAAVSCVKDRERHWIEMNAIEEGLTTAIDRAEEARYAVFDIRALPVPEHKP